MIVFRRKSHQGRNQETNQVHPSKPLLTKAQKDIVNFCSVPRSAKGNNVTQNSHESCENYEAESHR